MARSLLDRADEVLGYSLTRIMSGESGDDLNRTIHTQPAVFVHSMAILEVLKELFRLSPILAAGHSLGEYTALCAAGVMDFEDALDIIRVRAEGMDGSQPAGTCGMAAIIGISREQAAEITERFRGDLVLEAANFNAPDQVVISGHIENLNRVRGIFETGKKDKSGDAARFIRIPHKSYATGARGLAHQTRKRKHETTCFWCHIKHERSALPCVGQ